MKYPAILLSLALPALAQGPLSPPGSPAPTMKSLQEIWDKVQSLETENDVLKRQIALGREETVTGIFALLEGNNIPLPWFTTRFDAPGSGLTRGTSGAMNPITKFPVYVSARSSIGVYLDEFDGTQWVTSVIVQSGSGRAPVLAFATSGVPCVAFFDDDADLVKFAYRPTPTSAWVVETVDNCNSSNPYFSLKMDGNKVGISYFGATDDLRYASKNTFTSVASSWTPVTADSVGDVGTYTSLAFDSFGRPRISYFDPTQNRLKFAVGSSSASTPTWTTEVVDAALGAGDFGTSLGIDENNTPHIAYSISGSNSDLRYAVKNGSSWVISSVDTAGTVGRHPSLAFNLKGLPCIAYADFSGDSINYAEFDGTAWKISTAFDEKDSTVRLTLNFTESGQPWIANQDSSLLYTVRGLAPGP